MSDEDVAYFLFAAPNKIARFDLADQQPLEDIGLAKVPTAMVIEAGVAYVAYHRELQAVDLTTGESRFIRNFSSSVNSIAALDGLLYVGLQGARAISIVDASAGALLNTYDNFYTGTSYLASPINQTLYYRSANVSPSDIHALTLGADGSITSEIETPYHGDYPSGSELFLNASENKLYDSAGIIYFAADLRYAGSLGGSVDALTFVGDNAVAARAETLDLFDAAARPVGQKSLDFTIDFLAASGETVFAFAWDDSNYQWQAVDVASFELPEVGEPVDPTGLIYEPEFINAGGDSHIYLTDLQNLSVFTYGLEEQDYVASWPLRNPPTWVTYSPIHARLYLGYNNGQITYFDTTQEQPVEQPLMTLATGVVGLEAAGDYLFAADTSGAWGTHYLLDATGTIAGSSDWRDPARQYLYNPDLSRIYYLGGTYSFSWGDFDAETGLWLEDGVPSYPSTNAIATAPLILSDNHQYLLNGAGQIIDAISLNELNALSNSIQGGAWIADQLVTVAEYGGVLQFWSEDFELSHSYELPGAQDVTLFHQGGLLSLVVQRDDAPQFVQFDLDNLPDRDEDGVHDLADNCLDMANSDQADFDGDGLGDACDSDDDNDTLLDTVELEWGLNPLQADDATADLDGDGASNVLEIRLGTSPTDANSVPEPISSLVETFENGFPPGFYISAGALPWTVSPSGGVDGSGALRSAPIPSDGVSEISFTGFFAETALSLDVRIDGGDSYWNSVALVIDGDVVDTLGGYNGWYTLSSALSAGLHTITVRVSGERFYTGVESFALIDNFIIGTDSDGDGVLDELDLCPLVYGYHSDSDADGIGDVCDPNPFEPTDPTDLDEDGFWDFQDNCPETFNPEQIDVDYDGIGDACDPQDNRPVDSDMDGVTDEYDSCPEIANPDQTDFDYDGAGDACDADIDGDGIANDIEQQYDFLDPLNPADARQDFDEDGVANGFEIASNTDPEAFDVFESVSLLEYYPLREGQYVFADASRFYSYTTYYLEEFDEYADVLQSGVVNRYQRRADGVYITSWSDQDGSYASTLENYLVMPAELKLGEAVQVDAFIDMQDEGYRNAVSVTHQLIGVGETEFDGEQVPSVTIETRVVYDYGFEHIDTKTYLKGVGLASFNGVPLQRVHIAVGEPNPQSANEDSNDEPKPPASKSSGGSAEALLLLVLSLLGLFARLQGNRRASRV